MNIGNEEHKIIIVGLDNAGRIKTFDYNLSNIYFKVKQQFFINF